MLAYSLLLFSLKLEVKGQGHMLNTASVIQFIQILYRDVFNL